MSENPLHALSRYPGQETPQGTVKRKVSTSLYFVVVSAMLAVAGIAGVSIGTTDISWSVIIQVLVSETLPKGWLSLDGVTEAESAIIWLIRMPRVIVAALAGSALAAAGVQLQGIFRNPLADPNVIGVSQGAALGAVIAFITNLVAVSVLWLPVCAFVGAMVALFTVYVIASRASKTPIATLLLAGIALGAFVSAITSLLISLTFVDWQIASEIVFWMMGGLDSRTWTHVQIGAPFVLLGVLIACFYTRELDLMLFGEETSSSLGVDVESFKRKMLAVAALLTGAAVAISGVVGFVGLIIPHLVRLLLGPSHRTLLPASVLTGALFLIVCDLLARTINHPTEIRLGIMTAAFGAPFFLYLLRRRQKDLGYF